MASADQSPAPVPEAATGIQPGAGLLPAAPPEPAPPAKPPFSPERFARRCLELDVLLVGLVLVFSFLVASFAVRNGDFFRQIAAGRLLAEGKYTFGSEPFTWGAADEYWVNHSWLFGLLAYAVYQVPGVGGAAVVVLKALLIVALAGVLMRVGRRFGRPLWVPAACTGLAVLVLSPRLVLAPACLTYLCLGLTLWLLRRPRQLRERQGSSSYRSFWLLPPLFVLWVNLDSYFLLGPILVALYLAGEVLRAALRPDAAGPDAAGPGELRTLAIVLVVGTAACLINPFGYRAFTLPEGLGLSAGAEAFRDSQAAVYFISPLEGAYFHPRFGLSVAGIAYFPLLLLGLGSFMLGAAGREGVRAVAGWRLLVWLPFALMSLATFRWIGFFAVVAGPVTALNLLDFARVDPAAALTPAGRRWALGGRVATVLAALAAVLATVPGWLQSQPHASRRVAWAVHPDPSLRQAAEQVRAWREQGRVPAGTRWFNLAPEFGNYLDWFAPGERALLDQRYHLFGAVGKDFQAVYRELAQNAPGPREDQAEPGGQTHWRRILHDRGVRFVVVPTGDQPLWLIRLLSDPAEWVPCYLDGNTAVFGWREPEGQPHEGPGAAPPGGSDPFAGVRLDFGRQAFGPQAEKAPQEPGREPEPRPWWAEWWTPPPPDDLDAGTVRAHLTRFEVLQPAFFFQHCHEWEALQGASLAACAGGPGGPALNGSLIPLSFAATHDTFRIGSKHPAGKPPSATAMDQWAYALRDGYSSRHALDAGPPESLYLAVRAARRELAVDPDNARTHVWLGRAYEYLWWQTREKALAAELPRLAEVRRTQVAAALNNALKLGPAPELAQQAHDLLANLYRNAHPDRPYIDLMARHRRRQFQIRQEMGPLPGEAARNFQQGMDLFEQELEKLEREVKKNQDRYEVNAARKPLREQMKIALENGLAETALKLVRESDPADVLDPRRGGGRDVVNAFLDLLLDTGELDEARKQIEPGDQPVDPASQAVNLWFQVRLAAASGDYTAADRHLAEVRERRVAAEWTGLSAGVAFTLGQTLLREATQAGGMPWQIHRHCPVPIAVQGRMMLMPPVRAQRAASEMSQTSLFLLQDQAQLHLVRGWLALEAGVLDRADEQFRAAERAAPPPETWFQQVAGLSRREEVAGLVQMARWQAATRALCDRCRGWMEAARR